MLQSDLLSQTIELDGALHVLSLNSAAHPLVVQLAQRLRSGTITLAEDATLVALHVPALRHIPYHEYTLQEPPATMDVAILDLLFQPNNAWISYGLRPRTLHHPCSPGSFARAQDDTSVQIDTFPRNQWYRPDWWSMTG